VSEAEGGGVHPGELVQVFGLGLVAVHTKFEQNPNLFDPEINVLEWTSLVENRSVINVVQLFDVIFGKQSQVFNVSIVYPEKDFI
jgi:hypothetical protein